MDNIEDMIGYRPFPVMKYCWLFVTPFICMVSVPWTEVFLVSTLLPTVQWALSLKPGLYSSVKCCT